MKALKISAKDLGQLELDGFCQRCQYIKMGVDRRLPFQTFPGIFSSFDSLNKKMVEKYFDEWGCAPPCFEGIPECIGYEKAKMTEVQDDTTGFHVKGEPDAVFKLKGGKTAIIHILQDSTKSVELLTKAAKIVAEVAGPEFDRDTIRTEPFTEAVIKLSREQQVVVAAKGASVGNLHPSASR